MNKARHIWMSHVIYVTCVSQKMCPRDMLLISLSHVTYEWGMPYDNKARRIYMSHVNESCRV